MAKRLIKWPLLLLSGLLLTQSLICQVVLVPEVQASGVILKQQLWSVVINNLSGQNKKAILFITVTDRNTSQPLLEAASGVILLNTGVKRVMYNDLAPVSYFVSTVGFGMDRQLNQLLPIGEYLICYKLVEAENKNFRLANECVKVNAEPLSPPQLIQPANESVIMEPRPLLTWIPPAPVYMFNSLSYDIIVSPLYDKQSPQEALQRNIPVLTTVSSNNSILYPPSFTDLIPGKTYVWQVAAKDAGRFAGKSEAWTFTIIPDSVVKIINTAPFIKLSTNNTEATMLHQGVLKMEYFNAYADTTVRAEVYMLSEKNNKHKRVVSFDLKVNNGQNLLEYAISNKMRLDETAVYELRLYNSRNENWFMKFNPKYYF
jgi:hypothetical protein